MTMESVLDSVVNREHKEIQSMITEWLRCNGYAKGKEGIL